MLSFGANELTKIARSVQLQYIRRRMAVKGVSLTLHVSLKSKLTKSNIETVTLNSFINYGIFDYLLKYLT